MAKPKSPKSPKSPKAPKAPKVDRLEQQINVVWRRLTDMVRERNDWCYLASHLDTMLDDIGGDDYFGTERQCDPRGDGRESDDLRVCKANLKD